MATKDVSAELDLVLQTLEEMFGDLPPSSEESMTGTLDNTSPVYMAPCYVHVGAPICYPASQPWGPMGGGYMCPMFPGHCLAVSPIQDQVSDLSCKQ